MRRELRVLVTDYDRTLTDPGLRLHGEAAAALADAREAGLRVVVVSGRSVPFLRRHVAHVADAFVGDNGCYAYFPSHGEEEPLFPGELPPHRELLAHLDDVDHGVAIASVLLEHEAEARRIYAAAGHEVDFLRNRDRVMILPCGVHKGSAVEVVLDRLKVDRHAVAAAGDGENDVHLFDAAGYRVAVANAVPALKERADHVSEAYGGEGLARWVRDVWFREFRPREA